MDTQQTVFNEEGIRWHLKYNVFPRLSERTISKIISIYKSVQFGTIRLTDYVGDVMVAEMFDDLKIDY